jgi:hypothetical protein
MMILIVGEPWKIERGVITMNEQPNMGGPEPSRGRTFTENLEVASNQLVDRVKELVREGNVRRVIIRTPDGNVSVEIPLTVGVAAGGVLTLAAPLLAALGALAALVARVQIQIERTEPPTTGTTGRDIDRPQM